jgi:hypothetical protein
MRFNRVDYDKWKKEYNPIEPCIKKFCKHLVFKDVNFIPKNTKNKKLRQEIEENQQFLNEVCR